MIVNLTQHPATPEQVAEGVRDLPAEMRERLVALLTINTLPTRRELLERCAALAQLALEAAHALGGVADDAMIGGAPYLMGPLERALDDIGMQAIYSFSRRESIEQLLPDGSTRKTAVFRHAGWVDAVEPDLDDD